MNDILIMIIDIETSSSAVKLVSFADMRAKFIEPAVIEPDSHETVITDEHIFASVVQKV